MSTRRKQNYLGPLCWVVVGGLATGSWAWAQSAAPVPAPASQPADLGPPYVDGSFGFSVLPPAGCTLYREKQPADGDVEIARFINLPMQWSFTVRISKTTRQLDPQSIIAGLNQRLEEQYSGSFRPIRGEPARIASQEGVRYAASFRTDGRDWLRQQAVVGSGTPMEYFALVFLTPLSDAAAAQPLFDRIVASFHLLRDERGRERIKAALERGTALLRQVAAGKPDITTRVGEDNYLRCVIEGKDIGFVRISERAATIDHRAGVQIGEWGWLFNPDGSISHLEHEMFLSTDLSFERWANRLYILPADKIDSPDKILVDVENAIRQDDQLGVAYLPHPNAREKRDKLFTVEPSYASAAWNVLFSRVVDLSKPEIYAFSIYKSERRGMVMRTLEVIGPAQVLIDGQRVSAYKIEDSEGLVPPISELYVDKSGRLLRLVADKLEMIATTSEYVEQAFGRKVTAAQDQVKRLQPRPVKPAEPRKPAPRQAPRSDQPGQPTQRR